jgi:adenosylmethionine-8-amino-7-oxononanoate aminotransferase
LVQGAGGMLFHDAEALRCIRRVADEHGLLLIFDEIFTGFGRTGDLFACEATGVIPDIITLGKGLTGGTLPLAATIASDHVFQAFWSAKPAHALMHGPTFMGNALACAAANASVNLFERERRLTDVGRIEHELTSGLAACWGIAGVRDVRTRGAIGVVELESPGNSGELADLAELKRCFIERGVWLRPFRNIVYLTPALNISSEDLATLMSVIVDVLKDRAVRLY